MKPVGGSSQVPIQTNNNIDVRNRNAPLIVPKIVHVFIRRLRIAPHFGIILI